MSSSEIISPEVKHRRKILINQLPVILEPNIRKKIQFFFGTESNFLIMSLKHHISTCILFGHFRNFKFIFFLQINQRTHQDHKIPGFKFFFSAQLFYWQPYTVRHTVWQTWRQGFLLHYSIVKSLKCVWYILIFSMKIFLFKD